MLISGNEYSIMQIHQIQNFWRTHMTIEFTLKADTFLEFAFGKVIKGKEMQVFGEYFPLIRGALADYGIQPLHSFLILATNDAGLTPESGSFTSYPKPENYTLFCNDSRFLEAKPLREDGLEFLNDGNMFQAVEHDMTLDIDADYALVFTDQGSPHNESLLELQSAQGSPNESYSGKRLSMQKWDEKAELMLQGDSTEATVFKIRFNPSQG